MKTASKTSDHQTNRTSEFREFADKVCAIAAKYDVKITGYHSPELPLYSALSTQKQIEALHMLKTFDLSMEITQSQGGELDSQDRSLWGALSALGLVPPSDLFLRLEPGTAIEIYNLDGMQIWRNFTCMQYCSYTLEEVYSIELFTRYKRDPQKTAECIDKVGRLLSGQTPEIFYPEISPHILEETCSLEQFSLSVHHKMFSVLKNREGNLAAWLVMSGAEIVGKKIAEAKPGLGNAAPIIKLFPKKA